MVDIMNVNSILVHCDIIGASRVNGIEAPVIYVISHMTDQNGNELDLRGEKLTITFCMKASS